MADLFKPIKKKVNHVIMMLVVNGTILLILSILIVWTDFMARIVMGLVVIAIASIFFYVAYKIYSIKRDVERYFKI